MKTIKLITNMINSRCVKHIESSRIVRDYDGRDVIAEAKALEDIEILNEITRILIEREKRINKIAYIVWMVSMICVLVLTLLKGFHVIK